MIPRNDTNDTQMIPKMIPPKQRQNSIETIPRTTIKLGDLVGKHDSERAHEYDPHGIQTTMKKAQKHGNTYKSASISVTNRKK